MRSSRYHIFAMALVILTLCASCRQEICYDHYPAMDLKFTWELEWERDYGMGLQSSWNTEQQFYEYDNLRPAVPEWIQMTRYYSDGHHTERFLYPEGDKFEVSKNEECSILFYNGDTEFIILSDVASFSDVKASATTRTRGGSSLQEMREMYQVSRTTNPPDVIYSAFVQNVPGVDVHEVRALNVKMQPLVYTYTVTFEFESGIEYVALARGALGGMADGVYLRTGVTTDETSIILFDCDVHSKACRSKVRSFGVPGFPDSYFGRSGSGIEGNFTLNLEVKLINGDTKEFNFDISDQIKHQPRGGVIRVSGIKIEKVDPPQPSSGFDIDLTNWGDFEEIDLPVEPL